MEILALIVIIVIICIFILSSIGQSSAATADSPIPVLRPTTRTADLNKAPDGFFRPRSSNVADVFLPIDKSRPAIRPPRDMFRPAPTFSNQRTGVDHNLGYQNAEFTIKNITIDADAPCYLTGQPIYSCQCEECKKWRAKHAH